MEKIIKEAVISFTDKEYIQLKIHITSNLKNTIYDTKKLQEDIIMKKGSK